MELITLERIDDAIRLQEIVMKAYEKEGETSLLELFMYEALKELKAYKETGLSPEVCKNYKLFEDECISEDITFKDILTLKDVIKGMTCDDCRNKGMCAIHDNFNIRYCSDWEKDLELIVPTEQLKKILEKQMRKGENHENVTRD